MNRFLIALQAKYQAQIEESLAVLDLYFNHSVGVGEHPDIISILDENISVLENATSKMETIQKLFVNNSLETTTQKTQ